MRFRCTHHCAMARRFEALRTCVSLCAMNVQLAWANNNARQAMTELEEQVKGLTLFNARSPVGNLRVESDAKDGLFVQLGKIGHTFIEAGCHTHSLSDNVTMLLYDGTGTVLSTRAGFGSALKPRPFKGLEPRRWYSIRCAVFATQVASIVRVRTILTGASIIGSREEALSAYTLRSVLPAVDAAVYVDTAERVHGPPDRTASLLEAIFDKEIASGKLTIVRLGYVASQAEYPNALARNTALQVLQSKQVDSFMALDADDMLRTDVCAAGMVQISKLLEDGCAAVVPLSI